MRTDIRKWWSCEYKDTPQCIGRMIEIHGGVEDRACHSTLSQQALLPHLKVAPRLLQESALQNNILRNSEVHEMAVNSKRMQITLKDSRQLYRNNIWLSLERLINHRIVAQREKSGQNKQTNKQKWKQSTSPPPPKKDTDGKRLAWLEHNMSASNWLIKI